MTRAFLCRLYQAAYCKCEKSRKK